MLVVFALAMSLGAEAPSSHLGQRIDQSPRDVTIFVKRRIGCNHWAGEVFSDNIPERARQVRHALRKLRCDNIRHDERALQTKYRNSPETMHFLQETRDLLPGDY